MKRVAILGPGNAGKSTLAIQLGKKLNIPVHHLDKYFWKSGWVDMPFEEKAKIHKRLVAEETWIIEGGYSKFIQERLSRADTVILIDTPRHVSVYRWLKRLHSYRGKSRPDMPDGNIERFNILYLRGLMRYKGNKERVNMISSDFPQINLIILRNSKEVKQFIDSI